MKKKVGSPLQPGPFSAQRITQPTLTGFAYGRLGQWKDIYAVIDLVSNAALLGSLRSI